MKLTSQQLKELVTPEREHMLDGVTGSVVARLSFEQAELLVIECSNSKFLIAPTLISDSHIRAIPGQGASALLAQSSTDADSNFQWLWLEHSAFNQERALGVDQSNESIVLDEKAIIKWQLFAEPSLGAAKELCLSKSGFVSAPAVIGQLWWTDDSGVRRLIATLNRFVANSTDGWTWYPKLLDTTRPGSEKVQEIASLAAAMHQALLELGQDTFSEVDLRLIRDSFEGHVRRVSSDVFIDSNPDVKQRIETALASLSTFVGSPIQSIHGDFHVGQLIEDQLGKLFVIDFDGDPLQIQDLRSSMRPVMFDIASMMCSIIHAGMVAIKYGADNQFIKSEITEQLEAFVQAYELADGTAAIDRQLLWNLMWLLEIRELDYATQFLERWKYAPLGAIDYLKEHHGR